MYAKSVVNITDMSSTNVVEREFHSIIDRCETSERSDMTTLGTIVATKHRETLYRTTGTECNKFERTDSSILSICETKGAEAKGSLTCHL